jgi:hypothetical protein
VALIALTMLAVLAAGFSLAWSVGGRIARSVRELVGPAQALASGKPFAMPATTFREADMVAHALGAGRRFAAPQPATGKPGGERTSQLGKTARSWKPCMPPRRSASATWTPNCAWCASTTTWPRSTSRKWWPTWATTSAT